MPFGRCHLELYVDGQWRVAAAVRVDETETGTPSPARVEYDFDYLDAMRESLGARDARAVSCRYPVGYALSVDKSWPAFLLDLIPSGAARRFWEAELGVPNTAKSDWSVLVNGAGNPPGNVRVAEAASRVENARPHEGFTRAEVLARAERFIEYARERGASIAGGSGAGGDAPKFLLREDKAGRFHADGAVSDDRVARCWLVKFPRSPRRADRLVLEAEAAYHRVARRFGVRAPDDLVWERDCLFVPRFDCVVAPRAKKVAHLGMESLCSLAGVSEFGAAVPKEMLAAALARYASDPVAELQELLLRDVLDVALGNTDNHARNTAVLKDAGGKIELSPLYDFAPMMLDPQGIARVCRWKVESGGLPDWGHVAATLAELGLDAEATKRSLRKLAPKVGRLTRLLTEERAPKAVIEATRDRVTSVAAALAEVS